jgi:MFS family permease
VHNFVADLTPLRHRDFKLLFWGQLVSLLGSQITMVAIPYQVYELTHSPLAVGLLGLVEVIPVLLLSMVGGAFADARDRRAIVLGTEIAFTVMSALLVANALQPQPELWVLYAIFTAQAALFALQRPSMEALWPRLVEAHELTAAGALSGLRGSFGMLAGPAVGGLLIVAVGLPGTYAIDVLSFGVSLVALWLMRAAPPPGGGEQPSIRGVLEGLAFARSRPELIGTYIVDLVAMFFGMPTALFPAIADEMGGPALLGLLYAAPAAGALIATGTSGWTNRVRRHGLAILVAATCWGVAIIAFGVTTAPVLALVTLAIAGGADAISGIFRMAMWNQLVPDALRGRLASIELVSYSTGPALGNTESGLVASLFNVQVSVISGGVLCVIGCIVCAVALPAFRAYDARRAPSTAVASV